MQPATSFCLGTMEPARLNGNAILLLGASNPSEHSQRTIIDDNPSERGKVMLRAPAEAEVGIEGRAPSVLQLRAKFRPDNTGLRLSWQDLSGSALQRPFIARLLKSSLKASAVFRKVPCETRVDNSLSIGGTSGATIPSSMVSDWRVYRLAFLQSTSL
jgi:hypothetical protein